MRMSWRSDVEFAGAELISRPLRMELFPSGLDGLRLNAAVPATHEAPTVRPLSLGLPRPPAPKPVSTAPPNQVP